MQHAHTQHRPSKGYTTKRILRLLEEALRRDIHFIARHADDYPQALFQCLWNTCWWYDCPEAAQHYYNYTDDLTNLVHVPWMHEGQESSSLLTSWKADRNSKLSALLDHWRTVREAAHPSFCWLRSRRPPSFNLGGCCIAVLRGHSSIVFSVAYSPSGSYVASGSGDNSIRVWDALSGAELSVFRGHESMVLSVAFSPDSCRIASGSSDNTVRIWDISSGSQVAMLRGHEGDVSSVAFSPDGSRIASGSQDGTVRIWDRSSLQELIAFDCKREWVQCVIFSPDSSYIACGTVHGGVHVWNSQTGEECATFPTSGDVTSIDFSARGDRILVGKMAEGVWVWAWKEDDFSESHEFFSTGPGVLSVAFSFDDKHIAVGMGDGTVLIRGQRREDDFIRFAGHMNGVTGVAFSPDGRHFASSSHDETVRAWKLGEQVQLLRLRNHKERIGPIAFSPDGNRLVTGSSDEDLRIWDTASGLMLDVFQGHESWIHSVVFSVDGTRIISSSGDRTTIIWDAMNGREIESREGIFNCKEFPTISTVCPYRAEVTRFETCIERISDGKAVAWFPGWISVSAHPFSPIWAGADERFLVIFNLEGEPPLAFHPFGIASSPGPE